MKKLIIPVVAIVLAISSSAFTAKTTSGFLYQYVGSGTSQTDLQDVNNYQRVSADPCDAGSDVCGVILATDEGIGNAPDQTEFDAEKTNLWNSQHDGEAKDTNIEMKP